MDVPQPCGELPGLQAPLLYQHYGEVTIAMLYFLCTKVQSSQHSSLRKVPKLKKNMFESKRRSSQSTVAISSIEVRSRAARCDTLLKVVMSACTGQSMETHPRSIEAHL